MSGKFTKLKNKKNHAIVFVDIKNKEGPKPILCATLVGLISLGQIKPKFPMVSNILNFVPNSISSSSMLSGNSLVPHLKARSAAILMTG